MNNSWKVVPFGSEVSLQSGGTPKMSEPRNWNGDIPWVSSGEMTRRRIFDTDRRVTEHGAENGTRLVPSGTILVVVRGMSLAKEFRISIAGRPVTFNQDVKALVPSNKIDPGFLFYYLQSQRNAIRDSSTEASHGTKKLETHVLESWPLPIPDMEEQIAIRDIFSAYDDLIENNRRRIQLLEQAARLLYKEWFVHLRFPGHEHVKIKNGVPEGWEHRPLGTFAATNLQSLKAKELPEQIKYVDISSVQQGRVVAKTPMSCIEAPGRARRLARPGDTIWSNVRPNLKAYALILAPDDLDVFSTGFTVLTPTDVPYSFLYLTTTTEEFVGHLVNSTTGASYPAVRPDDFERAIVLVPNGPVLQLFHDSVGPLFEQIHVLGGQIPYLQSARDLLLPRLMNGEIAV